MSKYIDSIYYDICKMSKCDTSNFGDYATIVLCKDYILQIGYYSAGDNIAHFDIWSWANKGEYFDLDTLDFKETVELASMPQEDGM